MQPKSTQDRKSIEEQIAAVAPPGATGYRVFVESGARLPNKADFGQDYYAIGDYPLGAVGLARLLFIDTSGNAIRQRPQTTIQIGPVEMEKADRQFQSVEDKADEQGDPDLADESNYLVEINKQKIRRQRLLNIERARRLSQTDALLETMHGLVSDTLTSVARIDEVSRKHHEAQLGLTGRLFELARKAEPPPPPPDWPGMVERITGHLTTVVAGVMKARQAPPASHATHTLPVRDTSVDEWKSSLVESAKRTDRIEALLRQYLAQQAEARPEPKPEVIPQVMPEAITPELEPEVIPRVMPELEAEARPEAKPEAIAPEQMAEARPQPETTASNHLPLLDATTDTSTARPGTARNAPENPYRVAWNKIKRTVANLTDGDIMIFMAQPELAVLYMGMLASMVPTESPW